MKIIQITATRDITGREQLYALTENGEVWLYEAGLAAWSKLPLPTEP